MTYTLILQIRQAPGAMLRALGLIERRRFTLCSMSASADGEDGCMQLTLQISDGGRPVQTLVRQLEKQFDVESVGCWPDRSHDIAAALDPAPALTPASPLGPHSDPLPATAPL